MNAFAGIRAKGVETRPPSFFPGVCSGGYLFSSGGPIPQPPRQFLPCSQLISVIIPTLVIHHSFTLSLQAQNLPFQQILPTLDFFYLLDCLTITGWTGPFILFLVSHFNFIIPCSRLSLLPVSFLLHVKYTLSYRMSSVEPTCVYFSLSVTRVYLFQTVDWISLILWRAGYSWPR